MKHDKNNIIEIARKLVRDEGLVNLSRAEVCRRSGLPEGSFDAVMGCNFQAFRLSIQKTEGDGLANAPINVKRAKKDMRREAILRTAVELSRTNGYTSITRSEIATEAGVSPALITLYAKTMTQLRRDIMRRAIRDGVLEVIAQGLAARDPHAQKAAPALQRRAMDSMIEGCV